MQPRDSIGQQGIGAETNWLHGRRVRNPEVHLRAVPSKRKVDEQRIDRGDMSKIDIGLDIDALLSASTPQEDPVPDLAGLVDRQIAMEVARTTRITTLLLMGRLSGPRCLPLSCMTACGSFKLISMRNVGGSQIAMFSVPVESEMAELFEELDGRRGIHAIAYDRNGRLKEAYVL